MQRLLFLALAYVLFSAHDMFLKLDAYHLPADTRATIELVNGTFAASENVIDRDRMLDVSIVSGGERRAVPEGQWTEEGLSTLLHFKTGAPGTYVAGVSTRSRDFKMDAEAFNRYLEHDAVLDELQWRKDNDALGLAANERYSKHVKTIFQVGDAQTDDYATVLGYPIEFVPQRNPYELGVGDELVVRLLLNGEPLANQPLLIGTDGGHEHAHATDQDHDHDDDGGHSHEGEAVRTDADGLVTVMLDNPGAWHLRTIHMKRFGAGDSLTHESNWATLTFGVQDDTHGHGHTHGDAGHSHTHGDSGHDHAHGDAGHSHDHGGSTHTHDHEEGAHDHEASSLPGWAWWGLSIAVIGGLFVYFNRKG